MRIIDLPTVPVRAGFSPTTRQAVLDAVAQSRRRTMAEIICTKYWTDVDLAPVPMFAQTGDDRYVNASKAILKQVDMLPHGLINAGSTSRRSILKEVA